MSMQVQVSGQATQPSVSDVTPLARRRVSRLFTLYICGFAVVCLLALRVVVPFFMSNAYARVAAQILADPQHSSDQISQAVSYLQQACSWNPSDSELHRMLAHTYRLNNQPEGAVAALEQAYRLQPDSRLIQKELALAYDLNGDIEQADALWRALKITSAQMVAAGDEAMTESEYSMSVAWYNRALRQDPDRHNELGLRRFLVTHLLGSADAESLLQKSPLSSQPPEVYAVNDIVHINGAQLRWLRLFEATSGLPFTFGMPLTFGIGGDTTGRLWWSGEAFAVVSVAQTGEYDLSMHVLHSDPPPVVMGIGMNGRELRRVSLERGDNSWETITTRVYLDAGIHTIHVSFLNNAVVDTKDRNAVIEWVVIEEVRK